VQPLCNDASPENSTAKPQLTGACAAPPCIGQRKQRVSKSREKAPINGNSEVSPERETAGQAPVPYARDAPTSVSTVAGVKWNRATCGIQMQRSCW
jgi:hypothetical protein